MSITTLIIARHGNTFNKGDVVTRVGRTDLPLVASGLEQGRKIGHYLSAEHKLPDMIFTSTLKRTMETAEQLQAAAGKHIPCVPLEIFSEIDYGPDENQPEDRVVARLGKEALEKWDKAAVVPPGWKVNPQAIIHNWQDFAADLLHHHAGKIILVVTSNGIARFAPCLTGDFAGFSEKYGIKIATGAVCLFENQGNAPQWHCRGWNIKP